MDEKPLLVPWQEVPSSATRHLEDLQLQRRSVSNSPASTPSNHLSFLLAAKNLCLYHSNCFHLLCHLASNPSIYLDGCLISMCFPLASSRCPASNCCHRSSSRHSASIRDSCYLCFPNRGHHHRYPSCCQAFSRWTSYSGLYYRPRRCDQHGSRECLNCNVHNGSVLDREISHSIVYISLPSSSTIRPARLETLDLLPIPH